MAIAFSVASSRTNSSSVSSKISFTARFANSGKTSSAGTKLFCIIPGDSPLHGCVTAVDLQREPLIYRFGFVPSDILTLTDAQATRDNIETAFVTHLSEQAKPGDVVVFHFSGCGSRVSVGESPGIMQNSLVPADDVLPLLANPAVNDILEERS